MRRRCLSFVVNILVHIVGMLLFSRQFGELKFREPPPQASRAPRGDTGAVVLDFENDNLAHLAAQLDRLDNEFDRTCARLRDHQVTHLVQQIRRSKRHSLAGLDRGVMRV